MFGHETKKNPLGNASFSYRSSLFLTSLSLCINYINTEFHCPKSCLRVAEKTEGISCCWNTGSSMLKQEQMHLSEKTTDSTKEDISKRQWTTTGSSPDLGV